MSRTVLGSCDTLSVGVCSGRLAGDALIILRAVCSLDHSTLTRDFSSAPEHWIAVHPHWFSESFSLLCSLIAAFYFLSGSLWSSFVLQPAVTPWVWFPEPLSLLRTDPALPSASPTPAAHYCSPSHVPRRKPITIQRKIKVLSALCLQPQLTAQGRMHSSGWAVRRHQPLSSFFLLPAELLTRALSSQLIIINIGLS